MSDSIEHTTDSPVPTEAGWYLDREQAICRVNADGIIETLGDEQDNLLVRYQHPAEWAPFVRLVPETELAHTDAIKVLLERALAALRQGDKPALEFLISICDNPDQLIGKAR